MKNLKDIMTTIAGILGAIAFIGGTTIAYLTQHGINTPPIVIVVVGVCGAVSAGILGYLGGKNPDGSTKTDSQITKALEK